MSDVGTAAVQQELLTENEVSAWTNVRASTLRSWRRAGEGPPWIRMGRLIRYKRSSVQRWLDEQERKNA